MVKGGEMKLVAVGIALLLLGSASADAGIFGKFRRKNDLPKPIDSPIVRPKMRDDHKAGKRNGKHQLRRRELCPYLISSGRKHFCRICFL